MRKQVYAHVLMKMRYFGEFGKRDLVVASSPSPLTPSDLVHVTLSYQLTFEFHASVIIDNKTCYSRTLRSLVQHALTLTDCLPHSTSSVAILLNSSLISTSFLLD